MTLNQFNDFYLALKRVIEERVSHPCIRDALLKYFASTPLSMDTIIYMLDEQIHILRKDDFKTDGLQFLFHAGEYRVYLDTHIK